MASENHEQPKIGAGHAKAMGRLGLSELRAAVYPGSNIAQGQGEYGTYGNPTPQEIANDNKGVNREVDRDSHQQIERDEHAHEEWEWER